MATLEATHRWDIVVYPILVVDRSSRHISISSVEVPVTSDNRKASFQLDPCRFGPISPYKWTFWYWSARREDVKRRREALSTLGRPSRCVFLTHAISERPIISSGGPCQVHDNFSLCARVSNWHSLVGSKNGVLFRANASKMIDICIL